MNKTEFVSKIAKETELSGAKAGKVVQAVLDEIQSALARGDDVAFAGFGKFSVSHRAARTGVNPQDPTKKVQIPARRVPRFTPGAVLKQTVAGGQLSRLRAQAVAARVPRRAVSLTTGAPVRGLAAR